MARRESHFRQHAMARYIYPSIIIVEQDRGCIKMKIIKMFLPGRFEDAHAYMGWLSVLTCDRSIRMYVLEEVADRINVMIPQSAPAATFLFARNDWLHTGQFSALMKNPRTLQAFSNIVETLSRSLDNARPFFQESAEHEINLSSRVILDMRYYNTRLYLGADDGLYNVDVNWNEATLSPTPHKRLETRCLSITTGYGVVNASCADEGLFSGLHEFGSDRNKNGSSMNKVTDKSVRTGWMGYNIVNYRDNASAALFNTKHERRADEYNHEKSVITDIEKIPFNLNHLYSHLREKYGIEESAIQFAFNSSSVIFINTFDGYFYSLRLNGQESASPRISYSKSYKGSGNRILSASPIRAGLVIETDDRVLLFANGEWLTLINSPVLSVRTFASSKRFQHLITITTEEGVWLINAFDENSLLLSDGRKRFGKFTPDLVLPDETLQVV